MTTTHRRYKRVRCAALALLLAHLSACGGSPGVNPEPAPKDEPPPLTPSALVINEVVTSNHVSFIDEFGDTPDWIELYNSGTEPMQLQGYGLSPDANGQRKWVFGDVVIQAGQHLLVAASERDVRSLPADVPPEHHGLTSFVWFWADNKNDPPGGSYVSPALFPSRIHGNDGTRNVISAKVYLADNSSSLGWNAAIIHHGWQGWKESDFRDFSGYNRAYLEATLPAGSAFDLYLCQAGASCSNGYVVSLTGTGVENDRYPIPILGGGKGLDLSTLNGFEIRPVTTGAESTILISDFAFSHGGYYLHANFSLAKSGGTIVLSDAKGRSIDRRVVPSLKTDASFGRSAADEHRWVVFSKPTPGAANAGAEYEGVCPPPAILPKPGFYATAPNVTALLPATYAEGKKVPNDCEIRYTLDGTNPTSGSALIQGALPLERTTLVHTAASGTNWLESEIVTSSYLVDEKHELPVVSVAIEPNLLFDPTTGIYVMGPAASPESPHKGANFWKDVEVPGQIQFFEADGHLGFESGVGYSIFGNYSRANPAKSLAVAFRGEYGMSTLTYPLFPTRPDLTSFDDFVLRNSGNDFGRTMFRDALGSSLCDTMGLDYQAYRPSVVYINGEYWGIYNVREKVNADFMWRHHGLRESEYDLLLPGEEAQVGTSAAWKDLTERLENYGADSAEEYAYVKSQVDIDNFIDYNCAEIYDGNKDWPGNNVKWWKARKPEGRWRWVLYDLDLGFNEPQVNILRQTTTINSSWPNPTWSTLLLRKLLENPEFRSHFVARCAVRLSTNFATNRVLERIDSMASTIRSEIPRFFRRWNLDPNYWEGQVERLRSFASLRPNIVRQHFVEYFQLPGTIHLTLDPGGGEVEVEGVVFAGAPVTLTLFSGSPISLRALPPTGKHFVGYDDGATEPERWLVLNQDTAIALHFE